jgi:hypothetical protein
MQPYNAAHGVAIISASREIPSAESQLHATAGLIVARGQEQRNEYAVRDFDH